MTRKTGRVLDVVSRTNGRIQLGLALHLIPTDGDTAKAKAAGGGCMTQRVRMSTDDAIALYRAEKARVAAVRWVA